MKEKLTFTQSHSFKISIPFFLPLDVILFFQIQKEKVKGKTLNLIWKKEKGKRKKEKGEKGKKGKRKRKRKKEKGKGKREKALLFFQEGRGKHEWEEFCICLKAPR